MFLKLRWILVSNSYQSINIIDAQITKYKMYSSRTKNNFKFACPLFQRAIKDIEKEKAASINLSKNSQRENGSNPKLFSSMYQIKRFALDNHSKVHKVKSTSDINKPDVDLSPICSHKGAEFELNCAFDKSN